MRILHPERNTPAWLAAQCRKITESDAGIVIGRPDTNGFRLLAETLFLDFCDIPRDPDTEARRLQYKTRYTAEIAAALAQYESFPRHRHTWRLPGLLMHEEKSWLVCSPHAISDHRVVHVIARPMRRVWEEFARRELPRKVFAKCQVMMYITGHRICDVVDFWDSTRERRFDGYRRTEIEFDPAFIDGEFLPACAWLWQNVRRMHEDAFGSDSERAA